METSMAAAATVDLSQKKWQWSESRHSARCGWQLKRWHEIPELCIRTEDRGIYIPGLVNLYITTPSLMSKSTLYIYIYIWATFDSYVKLPEGNHLMCFVVCWYVLFQPRYLFVFYSPVFEWAEEFQQGLAVLHPPFYCNKHLGYIL